MNLSEEEFTSIFCQRPENFIWFLGAGASRSSGLPTATDLIWDMKRRYYCREENQDISRQDIQNEAIRSRIQAYMDSKGFPKLWDDGEYSLYFEKIFGNDRERQRQYLKAILSEEHVSLSVGNRIIGALLASKLARIVFTTNFDSLVEKAVAEVSGKSLSAYHLEGSHCANDAINNEEFPLYVKLHGDFRYDSIKNLTDDLVKQNSSLAKNFLNASSRYGMIVSGYSGRDKSIMDLFFQALDSSNPFPNGLYWTGIKGSNIPPVVHQLLAKAKEKNIKTGYIPISTFDSFLLRLWRNIENKTKELDSKVRKSNVANITIPLPSAGNQKPLIRLNALPIISSPKKCFSLTLKKPLDWDELKKAKSDSGNSILLTKSASVLCWGERKKINDIFGDNLLSINPYTLPDDINSSENLHVKGLIEEAICAALIKDKPFLLRTIRSSVYIIADPHAKNVSSLGLISGITGKESGIISGLFAPTDEIHPQAERVSFAEAIKVSVAFKNNKLWLLIDPDIWIWPLRARRVATDFMDERRRDRFNKKYNEILSGWISALLMPDEHVTEVALKLFSVGDELECPEFKIGTRTGFTRRISL